MRGKKEVIAKAVGLVKMRDLFQEPTTYSTPELCSLLGITPRTCERWLYDLDAIGCAIENVGKESRPRWRGVRR